MFAGVGVTKKEVVDSKHWGGGSFISEAMSSLEDVGGRNCFPLPVL